MKLWRKWTEERDKQAADRIAFGPRSASSIMSKAETDMDRYLEMPRGAESSNRGLQGAQNRHSPNKRHSRRELVL